MICDFLASFAPRETPNPTPQRADRPASPRAGEHKRAPALAGAPQDDRRETRS